MAFYKLSNPDQNSNNFIKLVEKDLMCCNTTIANACRNVISFVDYAATGIIKIVCKGKNYNVDISGATDVKSLLDIICAKIDTCVSEGGFGAQMKAENNDGGGVYVGEDNGAVVICLDTDIEITGAMDTAGADVEVTKLCEKVEVCTYQVAVPIADKPEDAAADVLAAGVKVVGEVTATESGDLCIIEFSTSGSVEGVVLYGMTPIACGCVYNWAAEDGTPFSKLKVKKGKLKAKK